jgi:hypothetical protein
MAKVGELLPVIGEGSDGAGPGYSSYSGLTELRLGNAHRTLSSILHSSVPRRILK